MKKAKLIRILAGFFALMLLFTFLSRAADSVNVAQVEIKTVQNQVITHEVTGTGKVLGTRERAVFTQEGQKVQQRVRSSDQCILEKEPWYDTCYQIQNKGNSQISGS